MKTLTTEFVITEQCNLKCDYCYMQNNPIHMKHESVDFYLENVQKMMDIYGCENFHISYFGGEPLLNWGLIEYAVPKFAADPRCHSQVIISNGLLLTEEKVKFIKENRLGFSWSFDGQWQDENRPHVSGKETLDSYLEKLPLIKELSHGAKVMISPNNISTMTENLKFFKEKCNISTPDFSIVRDDIWSDSDIELFDKECSRMADYIIESFNNKEVVSAGIFDLAMLDMLLGEVKGKRPFGCFAGCSGVGFFPSNEFYPCARFGTSKEMILMNSDGLLHKKNINSLLHPNITNPRTFEKCQKCKLYNYCNAGCTYSQVKINNGELTAEPVNSVCELFKIIYRETLRIHTELENNPVYTDYINYKSKGFF